MLLFLNSTYDELRPVLRRTSEEALVDAANILAEFAPAALAGDTDDRKHFVNAVRHYTERELDARIWSHRKTTPNFIIYLTDLDGRVIFHTDKNEIGKDYSRWIDVHRTLRGEYGARTTRSNPDNPLSSTMYVAAPVRDSGRMLGVLTVGQPHQSIEPFLEYGRGQILQYGTAILLAALLFGAAISFWLTRSIRRLVDYVEQVRDGRKVQPPQLREVELSRLARSTESMRREIEGKRYVEQYVQNLAHEMKSPLSAVRGAVEILQEPGVAERDRGHFLENIDNESRRMQHLIDRLLSLASLENRRELDTVETISLQTLIEEQLASKQALIERKEIKLECHTGQTPLHVRGEAFLLQQALSNLLDNALDFCPRGGTVRIELRREGESAEIIIHNEGAPIPDYALPRLFERFYSLSRPDTGHKSTGLGLSFVQEIAALHLGTIRVNNTDSGIRAVFRIPV